MTINGLKNSTSILITSPYDDCTMIITAQSSNPSVATVAPPGPVSSNTPVKFTITAGTKTGTAYIIFLFGSDPAGCVRSHQYNIPVTVKDPGAVTPPHTAANERQVIEPISMANGAFLNSYVDLRLRSPLPLYFERYYYSALSAEGVVSSALGTNWMHNYDISLKTTGATASITWYQGQSIQFTNSGGQWTQSTSDPVQYQLQQVGTVYSMLDPYTQRVYTFDGASGQLQTVQDRNGDTLTLTYANSLLSKIADGMGASLTFTYSGNNLTRVTDQSGRSLAMQYTGGILTTFTDVAGKSTNYTYAPNGALMTSYQLARGNIPYTQTYDSDGRVATQKDAANNTFTFSFNTATGGGTMTDPLSEVSTFTHVNRNLTQAVDPAGNTSTMTYDVKNRLLTNRDANGNTAILTYLPSTGLIASTTMADGTQMTYTYTPTTASTGFTYYDLTLVSLPDGTTETMQYDANGNVTARTGRSGQVWKATYNSHGQPLTITSLSGGTTTYAYTTDSTSTLASVQFPDTSVTNISVDGLKRITSRQHGGLPAVSFTYDAYDHILTQTNEVGAVWTYSYDANGLLASMRDPDGGTTILTRTGTDQIASATDAGGRTVAVKYDPLDRPATLTYADGSSFQISYDAAGNPVSLTDGEGKVWQQSFDKTGVINSFTTPLKGKTSFTLDTMGRSTQAVTPGGKTFAFGFDKLGRLTSAIDPVQHATSYAYDKNGFLSGITAPGGLSTTLARDALENVTAITDGNGNQWSFTYDGVGRTLSVTDPLGKSQTFNRDARGRITQTVTPLGTINTSEDATGRLTQANYPDGTTVNYTWDPAGHLTAATGLTFQYDASGALVNSNGLAIVRDKLNRVSQVTLAAGKTITYTYDRRGLVTQVSDWISGSTKFQYDDNSRLISIARPNGVTTTYTYDADGDVASVQEANSSTTLSSIVLTRDARGLVTQATRNVPLSPTAAQLAAIQTVHTFDAAGQIGEFQYDAMGRRTTDDSRTYAWDMASRLTSYAAAATSESGIFAYNGLDMLASQTMGGVTQQFVWNFALDLPSISVVRNASGDLVYYVHAPDGLLLHSIDTKGARAFYHYDEMGNTMFLTDDTGAITEKYAYSEYGTLLAPTGGTSNPFLFAGSSGVMQLGAGLYSMRLRVYDSRTGVFLSRDSQIDISPQFTNVYQYAGGNPLLYWDPTGAAGKKPSAKPAAKPAAAAPAPVINGPSAADFTWTQVGAVSDHSNNLPLNIWFFSAPATQFGPSGGQGCQFYGAPGCLLNGGQAFVSTPIVINPLGGPIVPGLSSSPIPVPGVQTTPVSTIQNEDNKNRGDEARKKYEDLKARIMKLYKAGKISAVQKNNLLLLARSTYEDQLTAADDAPASQSQMQSPPFSITGR